MFLVFRKHFIYLSLIFLALPAGVYGQLATYIGAGGTSTAVTGYANETVTALQYTGFGTNTACGSGGRSGITVNTSWATYNTGGPRLFIQIRPNAGYMLNMTGFTANLRASGTGPTCARFAYSLNSGATWTDDGTCHNTNTGAGCNNGVTTAWGGGALPANISNTVDGITIAIFPYASNNSSGTFQVNRIDISGSVVPSCIPPVAITGITSVCSGQVTSLSNTSPAGTWSTSNSTVATVIANGNVTGGSAGQAVITYATGCGTNATATVTVNPLPNSGTISGNTVVCVASATTLSSDAAGGVWSSTNTNIATINSTGVVTGANAGNDVISYTVTNGCGVAVSTASVTVNPLPFAGVITGASVVCESLTIPLSDAVAGGTWISSAPGIAAIISPGTVLGVAAGVADITYSYTNSCGTAMALHTVSVNPLPAVYNVTGGGVYCQFSPSTLHVGLSGSEVGVDYQLYTGASAVGSPVSGTGSALDFGVQSAAGNYVVWATNTSTGCVTNMSGSATITINPAPNSYTITGGGANCSGIGVPMGLSGSDVGFTYQLFNGSSPASAVVAGTGAPLNFGPVYLSGTYTILAVNPLTTCSTTMSGSPVVYITPSVIPVVSVAVSTGTLVCSGTPVTFGASVVNGGTTPFYEWRVNGVGVAMGTAAYTYTPSNGDVVTAKVTSNAVCAIPDTASTSIVMEVHTSETPAVNITVSRANRVCDGEHVTFTPASVFGGTSPTYRWLKNGVQVATGATFSYVPDDGDNIRAVMTSNFPCLAVDTAISGTTHMTVDPFVLPSVSIISDPGTLISQGQLVTLKAIPSNVVGSSIAYQWLRNGIPMAGGNTNMIVGWDFGYPNFDSISCVITVSGGVCLPVSVFNWVYITAFPVGVDAQMGELAGLVLLPNPNKGDFMIRGNIAAADEVVHIDMVDIIGRVVYSGNAAIHDHSILHNITLDQSVANGMYLLNVQTSSAKGTFKVMIER